MRTALLTSKRAIDAQSVSQREELLRSLAAREKQGPTSGEKTTCVYDMLRSSQQDAHPRLGVLTHSEDALMKANHDVTDALRRTVGLMQNELERSVLSVQMLGLSCSMRVWQSSTDRSRNIDHAQNRRLLRSNPPRVCTMC